jgi:dTDP-4-dehydrorhamnose reductase
MKIVVTGGSGLVGNHLKKILPEAVFLSSKDYNLILESEVVRLYNELKPDYVLALSALTLLHNHRRLILDTCFQP